MSSAVRQSPGAGVLRLRAASPVQVSDARCAPLRRILAQLGS